jgi:hypothetical protein
MNHRGAGPNRNLRKLDDIRDPVGFNSYFNVGGHRKEGLRKGNEIVTPLGHERAVRRMAPATACPVSTRLCGQRRAHRLLAVTMIGTYAVVVSIAGIYFDYSSATVLLLENGAFSDDSFHC